MCETKRKWTCLSGHVSSIILTKTCLTIRSEILFVREKEFSEFINQEWNYYVTDLAIFGDQ